MVKKEIPEILYHYTSIEAFVSIIESQNMRATRYDQMNDMSEVQLGLDLLLEAVEKYPVDRSYRDYKEFLISGINSYREEALEVYVLSLSAASDSLYQWIAYTPHGGVAIGFDRRKVQKGFLCDITRKVFGAKVKNPIRPDPANRLIRCQYTDENGNLDLQPIIAERFFKPNSYGSMFTSQKSLVQDVFLMTLSLAVYQTICSIKHGAYASEREWRCVNLRPDPDDYPVKSEANRFYIEMKFDPKEYIKEVWVSPHGYRKTCEMAVSYLKKKYNLAFVIKKSKIPFRR